MTTDFRALCAELIASWDADGCDWKPQHQARWEATVARARAALADEPAVPEGREPASVTGQPSDEELLETLDKATATFPPRHPEAEGLNAVEYPLALELRKARAVLARWGRPAPAAGEVGKLVAELRSTASGLESQSYPQTAALITRAADLLEQRHPAPVPVSERLPGPEDCDAEGRCWWLAPETAQKCAVWCFGPKYPPSMFGATHWLPAHALPIPHQQENAND